MAQLAEFDVKGLIKEVRGEFVQRKEEKLSILTRQMANEYIVRATEFCVEELKALSKGKSGLDSTVWSWEKPENISHEKLNQKLNAKIENMYYSIYRTKHGHSQKEQRRAESRNAADTFMSADRRHTMWDV